MKTQHSQIKRKKKVTQKEADHNQAPTPSVIKQLIPKAFSEGLLDAAHSRV